MRHLRTFLIISAAVTVTYLSTTSCSSTSTIINDFFGIQMDLIDSADFKIVSYTVEEGIQFSSSALMEKRISAWGEFSDNTLQLMITNNSPKSIPSNFVTDEFHITATDGKIYSLDKGKFLEYSIRGSIEPNTSVTLKLGLPNNFWETIAMEKWDADASNLVYDFWQGQNKYNVHKDSFKSITINLGGQTYLLLKPVPNNL